MILLRFRQTFRERCFEWVMAAITLGWGWNALSDAMLPAKIHAFDRPFYAPLTTIATQGQWGAYAVSVGLLRITCLYINGSRPRGSAAMRALGAWMSSLFWIGLCIGAFALPWRSSAIYSYGGLLILDLFGLWFAAADARLAFDRARGVRANGGA